MKKIIFIAMIICGFSARAQQVYVYGVVRDSTTHEGMIGAHIRNIDADSLTLTNAEGKFKMSAQIGDTLIFSNIGYKILTWVADPTWFSSEEVEFLLPVSTIYLDQVVVGNLPEYEVFKNLMLKEQPKDTTFKIFGVPQVVMKEFNQLEKKEYLNPLFIAVHPISSIHHMISKEEAEKRKMQHIKKTKHVTSKANLKFTREWVSENTKLEGDKLTSFIAYCNFSTAYLASSSRFAIYEYMMDLMPKFLEGYEKN